MKHPDPNETPLTLAVHHALTNAPWISSADTGAVAWCLYLAGKIEESDENLGRFGKLFESSLNMLGLSIAGRSTKPDTIKEKVSPLAEIRQISISRKSAAAANDAASQSDVTRGGRGGNGKRGVDSPPPLAGKRRPRNSENQT